MLDTGSADLWVNASKQPIPSATILESVIVSEVYADRSNFTGPVAFAPVEFYGHRVENQSLAFGVLYDVTVQIILGPSLSSMVRELAKWKVL